ncbi:MAG TPA: G1 family glutamic endopeptidase, partial [Candidatus Acidoferrales bacterium]|nr:G1 family glutamic endopeptidase [Candidatus Acidoferrales bacterium]
MTSALETPAPAPPEPVTRALGVRGRGRQASIARALVGTPVLRRPIAQAVAALLGAGLIAILPFASPGAAASRVLTPGGDTARPTTAYATVPNALWQPTGLGWYSSNWAGYAVANGPYRSVGGRWTVPQVAVSNGRGFSALWIGVDGFSNDSLIQAGTESDVYGGTTHYSAWWEILPAPAVVIRGLSIRAGDHIAASIARVSAGRWRITIR